MTDVTINASRLTRLTAKPKPTLEEAEALTKRRYSSETRLKAFGLGALLLAVGLLALLLLSIVTTGYTAFYQHVLKLEIEIDPSVVDPEGKRDPEALKRADYQPLVNQALYRLFPDVTDRAGRRDLRGLVSNVAQIEVRDAVLADPSLIGRTTTIPVLLDDTVDYFLKGAIDMSLPEADRPIKDGIAARIETLRASDRIESRFSRYFLFSGDSREPEQAGLYGALIGSAWLMLVTLVFCLPTGIAAAVYLEEFAPKNRATDVIEVNVNNLAAVPSIVFGLLGLAVFLNTFDMPRSAPLVGGLTLGLLVLPTIIVATRAALRAVPPSIRQAALGIGASKIQTVAHHVLPLAVPGILTGAIIGMAHALGETAPLLMIGMKAFIVDVPSGPLDPAAALPVQIYLWADSPERAFASLTAGAIIVLLVFLILMNGIAVYMRRRFERKW